MKGGKHVRRGLDQVGEGELYPPPRASPAKRRHLPQASAGEEIHRHVILPVYDLRFFENPAMELLLWRHAEAEEGSDDLNRPLTERGQRQAKLMAEWIRKYAPKEMRILVSPAVRTQQTATALELPFETLRRLGPDACVSELIAASEWPTAPGATLIIGHQPTLGRLAALLLAGAEAEWSVKKGALWWLSNRLRRGETQTVLRAMLPPDLLL